MSMVVQRICGCMAMDMSGKFVSHFFLSLGISPLIIYTQRRLLRFAYGGSRRLAPVGFGRLGRCVIFAGMGDHALCSSNTCIAASSYSFLTGRD